MERSFISVEELAGEPYSGVLGYPRAGARQLRSRVSELEGLGINSVSFSGPVQLGKLSVLGKGYVGVVVLARTGDRTVALKIRRTDSQRDGMQEEARLLGAANAAGAGPELVAHSKNFLVMGYADGPRIGAWVDGLGGAGSAAMLKKTVRGVLEDCYRLDEAGIDHGELSSVTKHVMVGGSGPVLVDFESSSTSRRPSNVTSVTQALYIGSGIARKVRRIYKCPSKAEIIGALREYKREMTRDSFEGLLRVLRV